MDVKPENIMVSRKVKFYFIQIQGYIKLIDFGASICINDFEGELPKAGTPGYAAPEVLIGDNFSFSADYYSSGACIRKLIRKNLKKGNLKDLMDKLLEKNPKNRISNFDDVKNHPYFKDFNWDSLGREEIKSPLIFN